MCVVSMIMDHYRDKWGPLVPPQPPVLFSVPCPVPVTMPPVEVPAPRPTKMVSPEEVEEFRRLLERAREYDKRNNEPDCELDEKKRAVKAIADQLGVKIDFL